MVRACGVLGLVALMALGAGCGNESLGGNRMMPPATAGSGEPPATGGSGMSPGSGGISGILGTGGAATGGTTQCGMVSTAMAVAPVPPDILVVFDRSATMADDGNEMHCAGGCGPSSKGSLLAAGVESLIAANPQVNWGLWLYGGDQSCGRSSGLAVKVGLNTLMPITAALGTAPPGGDAPTTAAINEAWGYLNSLTDTSPHYIMLVSDGISSCGAAPEDGAQAAETISAALSSGSRTLVVGMAPSADATATGNLDAWALAGGMQKEPGDTFYAPADLQGTLTSNGSLAACAMALPAAPAPGVRLAVSVTMSDGSMSQVPQDPMEGWTFPGPDETSVVFNGSYCAQMKAGTITTVSIYYSCPPIGLGDELRAP